MKALAAAYPDILGPAESRDGDWAVPLRGQWYYYAEGRLLPEDMRSRALEFDPQPFYNYIADLPPWKEPSAEEAERFAAAADRRSARPSRRSQHFYDALWRAHDRNEAYERVKTIRFLGHNVLVHYYILTELSLVEERILEEAKTDPEVRQWVDELSTLTGWNWRGIADTQSRSLHAYGIAIDLLPRNLRGRETYWLWAAEHTPEWWAIPYNRRFHPPEAVIKAFEAYGFIWGGKWVFFDTMHFEYRPELLILSGIEMEKHR
ncbi:M15 family metallopeptidase [Breznakiella homolactica]|uniref:M15 family metallopeptidase n=2 Tax=Breznakiella homolactica TaxID=2798577 RepID=A0A7T7XRY0_9SPIR|nr:M15 family metallopeptidase [Breznakiella homolactica]